MAGAAILGVVGFALTTVDLGSSLFALLNNKDVNPQTQTSITIVVGAAPNSDGGVPDIYVKGPSGYRLAEYSNEDDHLRGGASQQYVIDNIPGIDLNSQVNQPQYVALHARSDAICVSAIFATGNSAQYSWTGDMGYYCGAEWYASKFAFGTSNVAPKCVWLDYDHTNNIVASAMSLHMTDFNGGLLKQYQEVNEAGDNIGDARLCKNSARMTFYNEFKYSDFKIFDKVIEYNEKGEFVEPDYGIDRNTKAYPDGTSLPWVKNTKNKRDHARDMYPASNRTSNPWPSHLTVSHLPAHSARVLCESETSKGADFVAINDNETLFCDMTRKRLVDVCDEEHKTACFDLEKKTMRDVGAKIWKRDSSYSDFVPEKRYETHDEWK